MEISQITDLIIAAAPAITAVIGIIISLVAGIKRIKQNNQDIFDRVKQHNEEALQEMHDKNAEVIANVAQIAQNNEELRRENEELKRDLRKIMAKLNHVHFEDEK